MLSAALSGEPKLLYFELSQHLPPPPSSGCIIDNNKFEEASLRGASLHKNWTVRKMSSQHESTPEPESEPSVIEGLTQSIRDEPESASTLIWDTYQRGTSYADIPVVHLFVIKALDTVMSEYFSQPDGHLVYDAFISSGLLEVLMKLASDENLYSRRSIDADRLMECTLEIFVSLRYLFGHHKKMMLERSEISQHVMELYPPLFQALWRHRDLFRNGDGIFVDDKKGIGLADMVLSIGAYIVKIRGDMSEHHGFPDPPLSEHVAHVLLTCWITRRRCLLDPTLSFVQCDMRRETKESRIAFYKEVILDPGYGERFISTFSKLLLLPTLIDLNLSHDIMFLRNVLDHCPPLHDIVYHHSQGVNFFRSIGIAMRRQLCMGENSRHERDIVYFAWASLNVLLNHSQTNSRRMASLNALMMDRNTGFLLFPLAAKCTISGLMVGEEELPLYKFIGEFVWSFSAIYPHHLREAGPFQRQCRRQFPVLHRIWRDTVRKIDTFHLDNQWKLLLGVWKLVDKKFGFDLRNSVRVDHDMEPSENIRQHSSRCNWKDCLCHNFNPHHKMKLCKGCWNVMYCSRKCQTKDWSEGGHQDVCVPREHRMTV
ncbi:MYND-type zinc finger protein samB [Abortiporus biennis]